MLISKFDNHDVEEKMGAFEKKYHFIFPDQYREFLLKYNGGETPKTEFKIGKINSDFTGFYGFNGDKNLDFEFYARTKTLEIYLGDGVIPIGSSVSGDTIVLGISEDNYEQVYFIYHDRPKRYIKLANDTIEFINKCKSDAIGHVPTMKEREKTARENGYGDLIPDLMPIWEEEISKFSDIHQELIVIE